MKKVFTILFSAASTLAYAGVVHAVQLQVDYPAVKGEEFSGGGPLAWLRYIYFGAFAVIGIVAFASLVYAGIKWMTSRSEGGVSDAKDRIQKTLLGLLLAGASVLILQLINPDLVSLREPRIQLPTAPDRGEVDPGSADGREDPINQLLPSEPGAECNPAVGGCGLWRESIQLECKPCRQSSGTISSTQSACIQPGSAYASCPTDEDQFGSVPLYGQCNTSLSAPENQQCQEGLTCDQQSSTCRRRSGASCVTSLECATGSQCVGLKCTSSAGGDGNLLVEIHANPSSPGVDTPILHVVTLSGGAPNSSYTINVDDGDGRTKSAALSTDSNGFGRLFGEIILNYREEGTYLVSTTVIFKGAVVATDSYPIVVGSGSPNPNPNPNPSPPPAYDGPLIQLSAPTIVSNAVGVSLTQHPVTASVGAPAGSRVTFDFDFKNIGTYTGTVGSTVDQITVVTSSSGSASYTAKPTFSVGGSCGQNATFEVSVSARMYNGTFGPTSPVSKHNITVKPQGC